MKNEEEFSRETNVNHPIRTEIKKYIWEHTTHLHVPVLPELVSQRIGFGTPVQDFEGVEYVGRVLPLVLRMLHPQSAVEFLPCGGPGLGFVDMCAFACEPEKRVHRLVFLVSLDKFLELQNALSSSVQS